MPGKSPLAPGVGEGAVAGSRRAYFLMIRQVLQVMTLGGGGGGVGSGAGGWAHASIDVIEIVDVPSTSNATPQRITTTIQQDVRRASWPRLACATRANFRSSYIPAGSPPHRSWIPPLQGREGRLAELPRRQAVLES